MNLANAKVAQLLIPVDDLTQGIAFYRDVLGIPFLFEAPPQMAFFECGGVRLLVGVMPPGQAAQRGSTIYFQVSNIRAVFDELKKKGVPFAAKPHVVHRTAQMELWLAEFKDPDGNQLALMSEVDPSRIESTPGAPTPFEPAAFDAPLGVYEAQAERLREGHAARDPAALELIHRKHPRFLEEEIPWKPKQLPSEAIAEAPFDRDDARLSVARAYDFADWSALEAHVTAIARDAGVRRFESAVEAVIAGDLDGLQRLLATGPVLVRARSTRRTHFDPPVHAATLLHYVAANGVEGHRQRTPANAPAIARTLLEAGAEVDALARLYGGDCTTMSLLVSSSHPAEAGVQGALIDVLVDYGAVLDGPSAWGSPLQTALVFGFPEAAATLERRGARIDSIATAAGMGRLELLVRLLPDADAAARHLAVALAAQLGQTETLRVLLDAGESPDRYNPKRVHAHSTPLHQAVWGGHLPVVRLLLERGARLDLRDRIYDGTPLDWARHAGRSEVEALLRAHGAS